MASSSTPRGAVKCKDDVVRALHSNSNHIYGKCLGLLYFSRPSIEEKFYRFKKSAGCENWFLSEEYLY